MGIPKSKPSFSSVRHRATASLSAVTPLTKEIKPAEIVVAGVNVSLRKLAIELLNRFEPKGPS